MSLSWSIQPIELELRYTWKISRNASNKKTNLIVRVGDGNIFAVGEAAPNVRYNETAERLEEEFKTFVKSVSSSIEGIQNLAELLKNLRLSHALTFAIESAYTHYLSKKEGKDVFLLLETKPLSSLGTAYTLPIMDPAKIGEFIREHQITRFPYIKVKTSSETAEDILKEAVKHTSQKIMIDGNECWNNPDDVLKFCSSIKNLPVEFIEQPLPSALEEEYYELKKHSPFPLFADESVIANPDFEKIKKQFHGVNMKLMKAGGYLEGLRILRDARNHGMKTMIGCMVETTLGISGGFYLGSEADYIDLDGCLVIKDEPFGLLHEQGGRLFLQK